VPTEQDYLKGLQNAHKAGDEKAAYIFAEQIKLLRQQNKTLSNIEKQVSEPSTLETIGKVITEDIPELITGSKRRTEETESFPRLSEAFTPQEGMSLEDASRLERARFVAETASPEEKAKIIQENYPGTKTRTDEKGNIIVTRPDGKSFSAKPGVRFSDLETLLVGGLQFAWSAGAKTPLGVGIRSALTQAGIELGQEGAGGEFDTSDIATAGVLGAGGKALEKGVDFASDVVKKIKPEKVAEEVITDPTVNLAGEVAKISSQKNPQIERIASEVAPDPVLIESAERLGVTDYLQPDHISTNENYQKLVQSIKSVEPTGALATGEREAYEQVANRADRLIEEIGGTRDLSQLNVDIKRELESIQEGFLKASDPIYTKINKSIPPKTDAPAENILNYIYNKIDVEGGRKSLSTHEQKILRMLEPKIKKVRVSEASEILKGKSLKTERVPSSYSLLEKIRKELTEAKYKNKGLFKDASTALINKLEKELMKDQKAVIEQFGLLPDFEKAQLAVAKRKSVENDMISLFGKQLDGSIVKPLKTGTANLSKGDVATFVKTIQKIPESMRKEYTGAALSTAFNARAKTTGISFTQFANWYDGVMANKQAKTALFANLDKHSQELINDLGNISKAFRKTERLKERTGRSAEVIKRLEEGNIDRVSNVINSVVSGLPFEVATTSVGLPGAGYVANLVKNKLTKTKPDIVKNADKVLTDRKFLELAKQINSENVEKTAKKMFNLNTVKSFLNKARPNTTPQEKIRYLTGILQIQKENLDVTEGENK
jgi:hypothetical protein